MVCLWCLRFDKIWYKDIFLGMCVIPAHVRKLTKYRNIKKKAKILQTLLLLVFQFSKSIQYHFSIYKLHICMCIKIF